MVSRPHTIRRPPGDVRAVGPGNQQGEERHSEDYALLPSYKVEAKEQLYQNGEGRDERID